MTDKQYRAALVVLAELMVDDPDPATPEGSALLRIATACEEYEKLHYPIPDPTPEELAAWRKLNVNLGDE